MIKNTCITLDHTFYLYYIQCLITKYEHAKDDNSIMKKQAEITPLTVTIPPPPKLFPNAFTIT